jgi:hypothetical protein
MGGKNSLNPAKNPQLPKTSVSEVNCAGVPKIPNPAKNPRPLKIPLPNPKMVYQKSVPKICAKNLMTTSLNEVKIGRF